MVRLQAGPIDPAAIASEAGGEGDGAVSMFLGTVRNHHAGRRVLFLHYEAYAGMAEREMERIANEAVARFGVTKVVIVHRLGRVDIGEPSVVIAVASPHRGPALDACRFVIDTLKAKVPIWKREHFEGDAAWVE